MTKQLLEKYQSIIAEEVNVKKVSLLPDDVQVKVSYVPLGNMLGAQFGKDTGRIIGAAKGGNAILIEDGRLKVESGNESWELSPEQFEVRYSGFDQPNQIVEDGAMIEFDLELDDDLIAEGVAREISRFLNQMRKDAGCELADRVTIGYDTESEYLGGVIVKFEMYLQGEALVKKFVDENIKDGFEAVFEYEGERVEFGLVK